MTVRFRQGFEEHIVDAEYVELEGMTRGEIHNGKWIFKDEMSPTYTVGHNENETVVVE